MQKTTFFSISTSFSMLNLFAIFLFAKLLMCNCFLAGMQVADLEKVTEAQMPSFTEAAITLMDGERFSVSVNPLLVSVVT